MAFSSSIGSSVEGEKIELSTRQFHARPPLRIEGLKQYGFHLGINGKAVITQAYDIPEDKAYYKTSFTDKDDYIQGSSLDGWALKPLGPPHVTKRTASHSGTFLQISGGCYAHVCASTREHLASVDIQKRHPPIEQVLSKTRIKQNNT
jgi:hypothetical protein